MIKFFLPVCPVTKKNSSQIVTNKKTGASFLIPSKAYKQFESVCMALIPCDLRKAHLSIPVTVKAIFYTKTMRRCDLPNHLNSIDDVLVKSGVLADDNRDIIGSHDGSRVFYNKERPGVEITITPMGEDYEQWAKGI